MIDAAAAGVSYIFDIPTSINGCQNSFYCAQIKMKTVYQCTTNSSYSYRNWSGYQIYLTPAAAASFWPFSKSTRWNLCELADRPGKRSVVYG